MVSVSKLLKSYPAAIIDLILGISLLAVLGAVGGAINTYLSFNLTIGSTTTTINLGFIPNILLGFGGIILMVKGLYKLIRVRF